MMLFDVFEVKFQKFWLLQFEFPALLGILQTAETEEKQADPICLQVILRKIRADKVPNRKSFSEENSASI